METALIFKYQSQIFNTDNEICFLTQNSLELYWVIRRRGTVKEKLKQRSSQHKLQLPTPFESVTGGEAPSGFGTQF